MGRAGLLVWIAAAAAWCGVPTMEEHFGYTPGDDHKLAGYQEITGYFRKLAGASDRIKLVEFGKSANGKPMLVAFISSPENLARLDHFRTIQQRLALGEASPEEAARLSREGKAVVWIDSGLHATEVAPVQHAPHLAYRMLTGDSDEVRRILDKVILMQVPVINPDGLDWVVEWYRGNVKTPYELAPLPRLYQKYAGHDNNRDYFMLNLEETRHVARLLFREWYPQIVYNQHQQPAFPARIFIPPYAEPLNPHIPAPVMEGIHLIGAAMKERFAREDKPGVLSYFGFDGWWNGGLRSAPAFHNMHGILTETAASGYATPREYRKSELPARFNNGMPTAEPSIFYQRPWQGGWWRLRDAVDYMLTADFAILDLAASRPADFLHKSWEMAQRNISLGKSGSPYAYVLPANQGDRYSAVEMLRRLQWSGLVVQRAKAPFQVSGKQYPAGSWILPAAQPFRAHLVDLMEPQKYPQIRSGQSGPTKRPYDVAGWTLPMLMGVELDRIDDTFQADLEDAGGLATAPLSADRRDNSSYLQVAAMLREGRAVSWDATGAMHTGGDRPQAGWELRTPRVAIYEPHTALIDAGWTQWVLDTFRIPYSVVRNEELATGRLRQRFDSIILSSQSAQAILHGAREGESVDRGAGSAPNVLQRPAYAGGIGLAGLAALDEFVRAGGSLIAFDSATALPVRFFPLPVDPRIRDEEENSSYYCPGSILRVTVDTAQPLAFGMPKDALVFSNGGQAWDIKLHSDYNKGDREVRTVARYASSQVLASGWLSGEKTVQGKAILLDARHGQGHVYLFGFRPQFRGQTFGTFKFLLNAVYLASARKL